MLFRTIDKTKRQWMYLSELRELWFLLCGFGFLYEGSQRNLFLQRDSNMQLHGPVAQLAVIWDTLDPQTTAEEG